MDLISGRISASGPCGFLLGLGLGFLPFLPGLLTHSTPNAGGADVKLSASLGALLGGVTALPGLLLSLTLAVCVRLIRRKKHPKEKGQPFALVPYLAIGYGTVWVAARALESLAGFTL